VQTAAIGYAPIMKDIYEEDAALRTEARQTLVLVGAAALLIVAGVVMGLVV
jgi:hypothetical protein